jgi:hypothetical protein
MLLPGAQLRYLSDGGLLGGNWELGSHFTIRYAAVSRDETAPPNLQEPPQLLCSSSRHLHAIENRNVQKGFSHYDDVFEPGRRSIGLCFYLNANECKSVKVVD